MYLGNDLPLIIKYNVASLGEIRLCLAPFRRNHEAVELCYYGGT
jgi:hypothetical protein